MNPIITKVGKYVLGKTTETVLNPLDKMVADNISDITTTIGSFVIRKVRGKFQRSISFMTGSYANDWMEEALYGILYKYNNIKEGSRLEITNKKQMKQGAGMYYRLDDGPHNLKYRDWNILLVIQSESNAGAQMPSTRLMTRKIYTIITYNLSPEFVKMFELDMIAHRNSILQIKADAPTINVYQDYHESDGYTYWERKQTINKRRIGTVYLPTEQMKEIVDTVNEFFHNKKYYIKHGITHNLKILLYGPPGPQPVSLDIITPDGIRKFGDIKPGDRVFNEYGDPIKVEEVYEYDNLGVYEITFDDGRTTKCSIYHKFPVYKTSHYEDVSSDNLKEISVEEMLINGLIDKYGNYRYKVPMSDILSFDINEYISNNKIAEILGYDVACIIQDKLDTSCDHIITKLEDIEYDKLICSSRSIKLNFIRSFITEMYDNNLVSIDKNKCIFIMTCKNHHFNENIVELIRTCGYKSDYNKHSNIIRIFSYNDFDKFFNINKNKLFINDEKIREYIDNNIDDEDNFVLKITKITAHSYREKMHCLHVKSESHLYSTGNSIVTCNSGKDSIAKMIASEWNRNIYYITGGKEGKFIPNAICDDDDVINHPLFIISDIDKYPFIINEPDIDMSKEGAREEVMRYKGLYGNMINALDGILSGEDRIIIMTTNHIEKFGEAFLRPGRINLKMEIGYVTPEVFRKYVYDFYHHVLPNNIKLKNENVCIAEMQRDVLFQKLSVDDFVKKYVK